MVENGLFGNAVCDVDLANVSKQKQQHVGPETVLYLAERTRVSTMYSTPVVLSRIGTPRVMPAELKARNLHRINLAAGTSIFSTSLRNALEHYR